MTIAECVNIMLGKGVDIIDIVKRDCPSDYGQKDRRRCTFRKHGYVSPMECLKCWTRRADKNERTKN